MNPAEKEISLQKANKFIRQPTRERALEFMQLQPNASVEEINKQY